MTDQLQTNRVVTSRHIGKSSKMKQLLAHHLAQMKPGEKTVLISPDDTLVITRNLDQIESGQVDAKGTKP